MTYKSFPLVDVFSKLTKIIKKNYPLFKFYHEWLCPIWINKKKDKITKDNFSFYKRSYDIRKYQYCQFHLLEHHRYESKMYKLNLLR